MPGEVNEQAPANESGEDEGAAHAIGQVLAVLILLATPVALFFLVKGLYPSTVHVNPSPNFIDTIFANRTVIWASRLVLVSAAFVLAVGGLFIVVSTIVRMKNRDWLRRAGPFEVSETAVKDLEDQIEFWRAAAFANQDEIEGLTQRLEESDALIKSLSEVIDQRESEA